MQHSAGPPLSGIYGIVDADLSPDPLRFADALLKGGIRILQYRAKAGVDRDVVRDLRRVAHTAGGWLIVNDDLEAALQADGWHAGQADLASCDVGTMRRTLGNRLFGISCGTPAQARAAEAAGADYVGAGPFAVSPTKVDSRTPLGVAGVRAIVQATRLPVVVIGGICPANIAAAASGRAAMAAVISALANARDPESAAADLVRRWSLASQFEESPFPRSNTAGAGERLS